MAKDIVQACTKFYVNCPYGEHGRQFFRNFHLVVESETSESAIQKAEKIFKKAHENLPHVAILVPEEMQDWKPKEILEYYQTQYKKLGKENFYAYLMGLKSEISTGRFNVNLIGKLRQDTPPQKPSWTDRIIDFLPEDD